jgi:hypothetical protein
LGGQVLADGYADLVILIEHAPPAGVRQPVLAAEHPVRDGSEPVRWSSWSLALTRQSHGTALT